MRFIFALLVLPFPAFAWEFSPTPICTLTHQTENIDVIITFDAAIPLYTLSIDITHVRWGAGDTFAVTFEGPRAMEVMTPQPILSADGTSLKVRDSSFGDVLEGIEFNNMAYAQSGDTIVRINLAGSAPAVRAFRDCPDNARATY